jgi:hypothetical protein
VGLRDYRSIAKQLIHLSQRITEAIEATVPGFKATNDEQWESEELVANSTQRSKKGGPTAHTKRIRLVLILMNMFFNI